MLSRKPGLKSQFRRALITRIKVRSSALVEVIFDIDMVHGNGRSAEHAKKDTSRQNRTAQQRGVGKEEMI